MKTVNQIIERYLKEDVSKRRPRTQQDYKRCLALFGRKFGERVADEVERSEFEEFTNSMPGVVQRDKCLRILRRAFTFAVRDWKWMKSNVLRDIPSLQVEPRQRRYVTDDELESLRGSVSDPLRLAIDIAVETGLSQGAILELLWADVGTNSIRSYEYLSRKPIDKPITPRLRSALAERRKWDSTSEVLVCTRAGKAYTNEGFRAMWNRRIKRWAKDGGSQFRFHDLRFKYQDDNSNDAVPPEILRILDAPHESLRVELKSWLNLKEQSERAKVARALAALCNHGGGFLLFGFQKDGAPATNHPKDLKFFTHDEIAGIVERYLVPAFQCTVQTVLATGAMEHCVVVTVPSHGSVPICAKRNGPNDEYGKPIAVVEGVYYIRAPGPKSIPINTPDQWRDVIRRCVVNERDQLLHGIEMLLRPNEGAQHTRALPKDQQQLALKVPGS